MGFAMQVAFPSSQSRYFQKIGPVTMASGRSCATYSPISKRPDVRTLLRYVGTRSCRDLGTGLRAGVAIYVYRHCCRIRISREHEESHFHFLSQSFTPDGSILPGRSDPSDPPRYRTNIDGCHLRETFHAQASETTQGLPPWRDIQYVVANLIVCKPPSLLVVCTHDMSHGRVACVQRKYPQLGNQVASCLLWLVTERTERGVCKQALPPCCRKRHLTKQS